MRSAFRRTAQLVLISVPETAQEVAVLRSVLQWSIVRPGEFATNSLLICGPAIRASRRVVEPYPDQISHPIHQHDIADVVVADLPNPQPTTAPSTENRVALRPRMQTSSSVSKATARTYPDGHATILGTSAELNQYIDRTCPGLGVVDAFGTAACGRRTHAFQHRNKV